MQKFFLQPFPYLDKFRYRLLHVFIILTFSIFFLIAFKPFNIVAWLEYPRFLENFGLISVGVVLSLTIAVSQLIIRTILQFSTFRIFHLTVWLITEILAITFILTLIFGDNANGFLQEYLISLRYTSIGLILPFAFSLLVLALLYQRNRITVRSSMSVPEHKDLIHIKDDRDQVKFSVRRSNILYLESTGNYISIYYLSEAEVKKELVRNTMKQLEIQLSDFGMLRCHRSFMINTENIEWIKKDGRKYKIGIKYLDTIITVSRGYIPTVKSLVLG